MLEHFNFHHNLDTEDLSAVMVKIMFCFMFGVIPPTCFFRIWRKERESVPLHPASTKFTHYLPNLRAGSLNLVLVFVPVTLAEPS